ncbi:MAG: methionine--tRNA ligase [Patescibacteria group bacterium]
MKQNSFYITTTLPYVNAEPHVGFAMEIIRADAIARAKKLQGFDVFFNTGTDEHGQKLFTAAEKEGKDVKIYVDEYAERFRGLKDLLGISDDVHFIRTTDEHHILATQEFWKRVQANGYIYKKNYEAKYCVGCEETKTDSELVNGECPIHPGRAIETIKEENYFFKYSAFQDKLLEFYDKNHKFVVPDFRFNEIKSFVAMGLQDFSISRLKSKMSWGIPVPDDEDHVMYVWFDALVNYISTLGWPTNTETFEQFWKNGNPTQYCGKDNLRFQAAMWQAMLMAADLPNSHQIIINGFITGDGGIKMSKSIGNVINPYDVVKEYGTEALRFFLLSEVSSFEDSPFTMERFKESYNAKLANGLGNLTSRIMKMAETNLETVTEIPAMGLSEDWVPAITAMENFNIGEAMSIVFKHVTELDEIIQDKQPFKLVKTNKEEAVEIIKDLVIKLHNIGTMLAPVMPQTSQKIIAIAKSGKMPEQSLFLRKD